ncbi:MAG: RNA polymerase sigma factor FliA [Gammaproteobacteria bacterium]|jgi:RNA polymerase sigma factor for flagellar operon FliA|nr:RNA polymerase sigma factor FliA [Gammaproteobacteria bacterium]MBI5615851.1 RNA polymerase sigma factor FliA [Gammaproteobacteria bacterium]
MKELAQYKKAAKSGLHETNQDELVRKYAPLVKRIAYHLMSRLPPTVQMDDLVQSGMIGLLEAARNYDASQGASFETYAGIRIRGSMLDEIRKGDWAPRSLHRKIREITKAVAEIEAEFGRDARDAEVAAKLGMDLNQYYQALQDASSHRVFSFEDLPSKDDVLSEGLTERILEPLENVENDLFKKALADAIAGLPERERLVMSLYYKEELNLRETGEVLGVSESRVCQIHSQALIRLKARMADWSAA